MRRYLASALALGLLVTGPSASFAAQAKTAAHAASEKTAMGTVKTIDAKTLTIKTRKGDMVFTLDPAAHADNVAPGSKVTVHYKAQGKSMVATGVMVDTTTTAKK